MKNYYEILGILDTATLDEVRKAYRKLSKKFHPDKNDGDPFFESKFKEINEAYEVLANSEKRTAYNAVYTFNQNQQQVQEAFKRQQEAAYQKFKQEEERLRKEKEAFEKVKQAYNAANAQRSNNTPPPPPVSHPAPQPTAQAASNRTPIFVMVVVAILIVIGFVINKNHDGQTEAGNTSTEVPAPSTIQMQDSVVVQYTDTTKNREKAIESQTVIVAFTPIQFNGSDYNDLMGQVNNRFEWIINNASLRDFHQSKYHSKKLSLSQLHELYLISFREDKKDNIPWRFRNLACLFYNGNANPVCRDKKDKLDLNCTDSDDQFNFSPDYEIARTCSEAAFNLGYKCDVYGDLYRFGRGVEQNYLKAYDLYTISGQRGDEYYEVNINRMTQELIDLPDDAVESSGALSQTAKSKIQSIQPYISEIGRILTRTQFESLLGAIND